jgi:hypothetical protein
MVVMAGLVPAIHVFWVAKEDVDARHEAGHDEVDWRRSHAAGWTGWELAG